MAHKHYVWLRTHDGEPREYEHEAAEPCGQRCEARIAAKEHAQRLAAKHSVRVEAHNVDSDYTVDARPPRWAVRP